MTKTTGILELDANVAIELYVNGKFIDYAKFTNDLSESMQAAIARQILYWKAQGGVPKSHGISTAEMPKSIPE